MNRVQTRDVSDGLSSLNRCEFPDVVLLVESRERISKFLVYNIKLFDVIVSKSGNDKFISGHKTITYIKRQDVWSTNGGNLSNVDKTYLLWYKNVKIIECETWLNRLQGV